MSSMVRVSVSARVGVGVRVSFSLLRRPPAVRTVSQVEKVPDAATRPFYTVFKVRQGSSAATNNVLYG